MIHETAIVSEKADISEGVSIGPFSIIGPDVSIDSETIIESHVVITGRTTIGKQNHFYPFSTIGESPQDMKYKGEDTELEIGDHNTIRESCTINKGTVQGLSLIHI